VPGPVFKTGEGSGNRLLVGSIPMRSRQNAVTTKAWVTGSVDAVDVWDLWRAISHDADAGTAMPF
jgi:hypothetical protein